MTATDAIRFLHHQASECRDRDTSEAFCLLLPSILEALQLQPMSDPQAWAFRSELKNYLQQKKYGAHQSAA